MVYWSIRERKTSSFFRCTKRGFTEKHKDEELNQIIDLGTCGLHTANNAFKYGEKFQTGNSKNLCHL